MRQNIFRRNKKGVVLLTVICVMMILILTVTATLAVLSASQAKALTNYTDSQSYITAKSVVDTYRDCLLKTSETSYDSLRNSLMNMTVPIAPATTVKEFEVVMPDVEGLGKLTLGKTAGLTTKQVVTVTRYSATEFKISATAIDDKSTNTVSLKLTANPITPPSAYNSAAQALNKIDNATDLSIIGGASSNGVGAGAAYGGLKGTTSSIFYVSDININNSGNGPFGAFNLGPNQSVVSGGNIAFNGNMGVYMHNSDPAKPSFIYAGGSFTTNSVFSAYPLGTSSDPVNIICHGGTMNMTCNLNGNVYSLGNMTFTDRNNKINSEMYIQGNASFLTDNMNSPFRVTTKFGSSKIHYSGNLSVSDSSGTTYTTSLISSMQASGNTSTKALGDALAAVFIHDPTLSLDLVGTDVSATDLQKNLVLPGKNFILPTSASVFKSCIDAGGPIPAETYATTAGCPFPTPTGNASNATNTSITVNGRTPATVITGSGILPPGTYDAVIDATTNPVNLSINNTGLFSGKIVVKGNQKVNIYSTTDVNIQGFKLLSEAAEAVVLDPTNKAFRIGTQNLPNVVTPAPNIEWFVGNGTNLNLGYTGSTYPMINAYIYGATADLNIAGGMHSDKYKINDNLLDRTDVQLSIVGACIFNNINIGGGAETGFLYIDPKAGGPTPPPSSYLWNSTYYANN